MARTLMHALEVGVPVYNIHFADENTAVAAAKKAECHAWVLRTGGGVFYLTDSHSSVREIVEQVAEDTSHTYILAVRRAGSKNGPRVKLRDGQGSAHPLRVVLRHRGTDALRGVADKANAAGEPTVVLRDRPDHAI